MGALSSKQKKQKQEQHILPPPYEKPLINIVRHRVKSQLETGTVYNNEKKQILFKIDEKSKLCHTTCAHTSKMPADLLVSQLKKDPDFK